MIHTTLVGWGGAEREEGGGGEIDRRREVVWEKRVRRVRELLSCCYD